MEPYGAIRAEAQRWLGIAVKLLSGRDLVGSKTFAIRARESDPRLEFADQILAVADTLIASEKRINNQPDWYAILQLVSHTHHDSELIASQYRRLALLLNPQQCNLPFADLAFKLVCDAWLVLSHPGRKSVYDSEISFLSVVSNNQGGSNLNMNVSMSMHQQQQNHHQNQQNLQHQQWQQTFQNVLSRPVPQPPQLSRPVPQQLLPPRPVPEQPVNFWQEIQTQPPQIQQAIHQNPSRVIDKTVEETQQVQLKLNPRKPEEPKQQQKQQQSSRKPEEPKQQQQQNQQKNPRKPEEPKQQQQQQQQNKQQNPRQPEEPIQQQQQQKKQNPIDVDEGVNFWTACPYCFNMYEYPRVYVDCCLRCQNCKRAFQAVNIPMEPPVFEGNEARFSCWGFFPVGVSMSSSQAEKDKSLTNWSPFSPIFTLPKPTTQSNGVEPSNTVNTRASTPNSPKIRKTSAPRVYVDDEDEEDGDEYDENDDSDDDDDWGRSGTKRKKANNSRGKTSWIGRPPRQSQVDKTNDAIVVDSGESSQVTKEISQTPSALKAKKAVVSTRRQPGRGAKLDLNVEFSNEGEEQAHGGVSEGNRNVGHRSDDNIEGIGFFEGLDEFLSSLPILVGDDKVKAA